MPEFDIRVETPAKGTAVVRVNGFLDAHTFERMERAFEDLFAQARFRVVVDLSGVDYISSAGAGVFIGGVTSAQENGGNIVLVHATPPVQEVFELLGLNQILTFAATEDAALASLGTS